MTSKSLFVVNALLLKMSIGKYSCPGKQLALLEIRQVIYEIARRYDISFFEPKTRLSFPEDIIDGFSLHCPKLELVFSSRSTH